MISKYSHILHAPSIVVLPSMTHGRFVNFKICDIESVVQSPFNIYGLNGFIRIIVSYITYRILELKPEL